MICNWMIDGELIDNYDEFFICQYPDINNLDMWNNRYTIRYVLFCFIILNKLFVVKLFKFQICRVSMIPVFFTKEDVNQIFRTGRYINFLHTICKSKPDLTPSRKVLKDFRNSGGMYVMHNNIILKVLIHSFYYI